MSVVGSRGARKGHEGGEDDGSLDLHLGDENMCEVSAEERWGEGQER
jgi:hypothetical protein